MYKQSKGFVKPYESTNDILKQELVGFRDLIVVLLQGHRRELSHHLVHAVGPVAHPQQLYLHSVKQFEPTAVLIVGRQAAADAALSRCSHRR